jgi:hypothetical protein
VLGRFSGPFFTQALGIFHTEFGRFARRLVRRHDAVARRQFELLVRSARQTLELVQVEAFHLLARPIRLFQEFHAGIDARVVLETLDVQIGEQ